MTVELWLLAIEGDFCYRWARSRRVSFDVSRGENHSSSVVYYEERCPIVGPHREEGESVLGDQGPGRVDEGGDCLGYEDDLEDTQRVQEKGGNTEKCDVVTVHQESSGKIVLEMSSSFFRDRSLFSAPVLPFDPIGNSLDRFRFFAFTPTEG